MCFEPFKKKKAKNAKVSGVVDHAVEVGVKWDFVAERWDQRDQ